MRAEDRARHLQSTAVLVFSTTGAWGFMLCLGFILDRLGYFGVFVAILLGPITFATAPAYIVFAQGNWLPAAFSYGGAICAGVLARAGGALRSRYERQPISLD